MSHNAREIARIQAAARNRPVSLAAAAGHVAGHDMAWQAMHGIAPTRWGIPLTDSPAGEIERLAWLAGVAEGIAGYVARAHHPGHAGHGVWNAREAGQL